MRIQIDVAQLEFDEDGQTMWIHGPEGATVLRIKCKRISVVRECINICAHADVYVPDVEIEMCIPAEKKVND